MATHTQESINRYLDNAPLYEAIKNIDDGVISYGEVLRHFVTPLPNEVTRF